MATRYKANLNEDKTLTIPYEICCQERFLLKKGTRLVQSLEEYRILLYRADESPSQLDAANLDKRCALILNQKYLDQLSILEGEPLYLSVEGDLIAVEKARCERCGREEKKQLVEYESNTFMCIPCVSCAIHFEKERRR